MKNKIIGGFSKLSKNEKLQWVADHTAVAARTFVDKMRSFWVEDKELQKVIDGFSENTLSNFPMPFGVAPNFLVNGKIYTVPMVIEESSVVAASSSAAKFWLNKGGFKAEVLSTTKVGHVYFYWHGKKKKLREAFPKMKAQFLVASAELTQNMEKRGGGVRTIELIDKNDLDAGYYQLEVTFETVDSMGANFINSILEEYAGVLTDYIESAENFQGQEKEVKIIMSILSNYTPECIVRASVECPIDDLENAAITLNAKAFAKKFYKAVHIAEIDTYRAVTHNKGIYNGVDAVVLATGNDFRAVEACGHAYAARNGRYASLSHCSVEGNMFRFWMDLPLAIGTVGGLTSLHPFAKEALAMLGNPKAEELMEVIAATGLAQNFAALRSLISTGIQKGHMKMHLTNILNQHKATEMEQQAAREYFQDKIVSFNAVSIFLDGFRKKGE